MNVVVVNLTRSCANGIETVANVLRNLAALSASTIGSSGLHSICLISFGDQVDVLFRAQPLKGNFNSFNQALDRLLDLSRIADSPHTFSKNVFLKTLSEIGHQLRSYATSSFNFQREIVIFSDVFFKDIIVHWQILIDLGFNEINCIESSFQYKRSSRRYCGSQSIEIVKTTIGFLSSHNLIQVVKKICFYFFDTTSPESPLHSLEAFSENDQVDGIYELVYFLQDDRLKLLLQLKNWYHTVSKDIPDIEILLPDDSKLLCDYFDVFINPLTILNARQFFIFTNNSLFSQQLSLNQPTLTAQSSSIRLQAVSLLKNSGICESVIYGIPLKVDATLCWKLEWDFLEHNQAVFLGLCKYLFENHLSLLVKSTSNAKEFSAYFILMVGNESHLLLKSIATQDLMAPISNSTLGEIDVCDVSQTLSNLEIKDIFNPFEFDTNLFKGLIHGFERICKSQPRAVYCSPYKSAAVTSSVTSTPLSTQSSIECEDSPKSVAKPVRRKLLPVKPQKRYTLPQFENTQSKVPASVAKPSLFNQRRSISDFESALDLFKYNKH